MAVFVDTYTEASADTELTAHTPDTGTGYSRIHSDGANPRISAIAATDRAKVSTGGNDSGVVYTCNGTYPSANYELEVTYNAGSAFATRPFYWTMRLADVENMYALRMTAVASGHQLYKKVAGTWTALGSAVTIATGSVIKISVNGTAIKVFDDGAEVISVTDSSLSAAGKAGMAVGGGSELVTSTDDANGSWEFDGLTVTDLGGGDTQLVVADATHAHTSETPALTQAYVLTVNDAGHASGAENVALTQAYLLAVADAEHAHTAETPALIQAYVLVVADSTHSHTAENVDLTQAYTLTVAAAEHVHEAENVTISPDSEDDVQLTVADAEHVHTSETVALVQNYLLTVSDVTHLHTAENVTLTQAFLLAVSDATHSHTAEAPALVQAYVLTVAGVTHNHTAANVVLSEGVQAIGMRHLALEPRSLVLELAPRSPALALEPRSVELTV